MKPFRKGGTQNLAKWSLQGRARQFDDLSVGQILLDDSIQFGAHNLCRITQICPERRILYAVFVNPINVTKVRDPGDGEFGIHEFELENQTSSRFYYAVPGGPGVLHVDPDPDELREPMPHFGPLLLGRTNKPHFADWML